MNLNKPLQDLKKIEAQYVKFLNRYGLEPSLLILGTEVERDSTFRGIKIYSNTNLNSNEIVFIL